MKKSLIAAVFLSVSVSGCGTLWMPPEPPFQRMDFPEHEYKALKISGNSQVTGQVFAKTRGGDVKLGAGNEVILNPVTSYSNQWYVESYLNRNTLSQGDDRIFKYMKKTISDGSGRFTFKNVPEGEYYVVSRVTWEVSNGSYMTTQGGFIAKKIKVQENDVVDVMLTR